MFQSFKLNGGEKTKQVSQTRFLLGSLAACCSSHLSITLNLVGAGSPPHPNPLLSPLLSPRCANLFVSRGSPPTRPDREITESTSAIFGGSFRKILLPFNRRTGAPRLRPLRGHGSRETDREQSRKVFVSFLLLLFCGLGGGKRVEASPRRVKKENQTVSARSTRRKSSSPCSLPIRVH